MILGLLVGNSSLRFGVRDETRILFSKSVPWRELSERSQEVSRLLAAQAVEAIVVGSVRDDLLPLALKCLPPGSPPARLARRDFALPLENRYERPPEAGTDRLLNALAASKRAGARGAIVVDFGTAISISAVAPDGAFLGGLIAAGGAALARGLRELTPRLPAVESLAPGSFLERTTARALRSGLYWQLAGGVSAILRGLVGELPFPAPRTLATGGAAELFAPQIPAIDEVVPDLALEGLFLAYEAAG